MVTSLVYYYYNFYKTCYLKSRKEQLLLFLFFSLLFWIKKIYTHETGYSYANAIKGQAKTIEAKCNEA